MAIVWDGKARAVCPVCGPSGCVDGPAHGVVFADEPESTAEALEAYWRASGRVLGWFRADPLDEAKPRVAVTRAGLGFVASPPALETLCARVVLEGLAARNGATARAAAARLPPAARRALLGAQRRVVDAAVGSGAGVDAAPTRRAAPAPPPEAPPEVAPEADRESFAALAAALPCLAAGARLTTLDLSRGPGALAGAALAAAAPSLGSLTALDVSECSGAVGDAALGAVLAAAAGLRVLALAGARRVAGAGLGRLPRLESLDCRRCGALEPAAVRACLRRARGLATLLLADCGRVDDGAFGDDGDGVRGAAPRFPALRGVDVSRTRCSSAAAAILAAEAPGLSALRLAEAANLDADAALAAAAGLAGLEELDASAAPLPRGWRRGGLGGGGDARDNAPWWCADGAEEAPRTARGASDRGLAALAAGAARRTLRVLRVRGGSFSDGALATLGAACPRLEDVDVSRCDRISERALAALVDAAADLCALTARRCARVSDRATFLLFHALEARGGDLRLAVQRACRYRPSSRLPPTEAGDDDSDDYE